MSDFDEDIYDLDPALGTAGFFPHHNHQQQHHHHQPFSFAAEMSGSPADVALARAVCAGDVAGARAALDGGADPNVRLGDERIPLLAVAACFNSSQQQQQQQPQHPAGGPTASSTDAAAAELVRLLASYGADPAATCSAGRNALHRAAACPWPGGSGAAVAALIDDAGAAVEAGDARAMTALAHAAAAGNAAAAEALLTRGANVNAKDRESATPLHYAAKADRPELCALLLKWGADPAAKHGRCSTPLHFAAGFGCARCIEVLLDSHRVPPDIAGGGKQTPLHFSVHNRHLDCARLLVARGASPRAISAWGTPLQMALNNGDADMVAFLRTVLGPDALQSAPPPAAVRPPSPLPRVAYSSDPMLAPLEANAAAAQQQVAMMQMMAGGNGGGVNAAAGSVALPLIVQAFPHLNGRQVFFNGADSGAVLCMEGLRHSDGSVYTTPTSFTRRLSGSRSSGWKQLSVLVERKQVPLWYYKNFYLTHVAPPPQPINQPAFLAAAAAASAYQAPSSQQQANPMLPQLSRTTPPPPQQPLPPPSLQQPQLQRTGWQGLQVTVPSAVRMPVAAVRSPTGPPLGMAASAFFPPTGLFLRQSPPPQPQMHPRSPAASPPPPPQPQSPPSPSGKWQSSPTSGSPPGPMSVAGAMRQAAGRPHKSFRLAGRIPTMMEADVQRSKEVIVSACPELRAGTMQTTKVPVLVRKFAPKDARAAMQEIEQHCMLHHVHVLTIFGHYVDIKGRVFLVLEHVATTLRQRLAGSGPLPLLETLRIAHGIARALKALHGTEGHPPLLGLAPESVLLTHDSVPKLCDFGPCEWLLGAPPKPVAMTYRAPELLEKSQATASATVPSEKTDVYAFGCILREMLGNAVCTDYVRGNLTSLARMCNRSRPESRPTFAKAVELLDGLQLQPQSFPFWSSADRMQFVDAAAEYLQNGGARSDFGQELEARRESVFGPDWRNALDAPLQDLVSSERCDMTSLGGLVGFVSMLHKMAADDAVAPEIELALREDGPEAHAAGTSVAIAVLPYIERRFPGLVGLLYDVLTADEESQIILDVVSDIGEKYLPLSASAAFAAQ